MFEGVKNFFEEIKQKRDDKKFQAEIVGRNWFEQDIDDNYWNEVFREELSQSNFPESGDIVDRLIELGITNGDMNEILNALAFGFRDENGVLDISSTLKAKLGLD